jgi:hypothetical protein
MRDETITGEFEELQCYSDTQTEEQKAMKGEVGGILWRTRRQRDRWQARRLRKRNA